MFRRFLYKKTQIFSLLKLRQFRETIRRDSQHDTFQLADSSQLPKPPKTAGALHLMPRTVDGSYNNLDHPEMGMSCTLFGRNVLLADSYLDEQTLLTPNPHLLNLRLITREKFKPATIVNLLAAAWIQFTTQDWMTRDGNQPNNKLIFSLSMMIIGRKKNDQWKQNIQLTARQSINKYKFRPFPAVPSIV